MRPPSWMIRFRRSRCAASTVGGAWRCPVAHTTVSKAPASRDVGARSIAFPAVSAGLYAWPADDVARIAVAAVRGAPELEQLDVVRFVLFNDALHRAFLAALA